MKKYLIISFALIFLLTLGAVSAGDAHDLADGSVISLANADDNEQSVVGDLNDFEEESTVAMQENAPDQSDVLSDAGQSVAVDVEDVTLNESETVAVPFDVSGSGGALVSGGVNVTISGEKDTISKYVELNNVTGQTDMNLIDFIEIIKANGLKVSDIYNLIYSNSNFTDTNVSQIVSGLDKINAGWSVNIQDIREGADYIINGTQVDDEKLVEGIKEILTGIKINISEFVNGSIEIMDGIDVNASYMPKLNSIVIAILDGFEIDGSKLLNRVLDSIIINRAAFVGAVNAIAKEFNGGSSQASLSDLMSRLHLELSTKIKLELALLAVRNEFTLLEVVDIAKEIWNYNGLTKTTFLNRLRAVTNDFTFNISDIIKKIGGSSGTKDLGVFTKLIDSARIDSNRFSNAIIDAVNGAKFDKSKVTGELAEITGIDSSKISKIIDEVAVIFQSVKFNVSNVVFGFKEILNGFHTSNSDFINKIWGAISFNEELFIADSDKLLDKYNFTKDDVKGEFYSLIKQLNLKVPNELDVALSDSFSAEKLNFTRIGSIFYDILAYNNLSGSNFASLLSNCPDGVTLNLTKIIYRIANHHFNTSKIVHTILLIMHYVDVDYAKLLTSMAESAKSVSFNRSVVESGISRMFAGASFDVSKAITGINNLAHEIDFDESKAIEVLQKIDDHVDIYISEIIDGLNRVADSFSFDESTVDSGLAKVISAFSFKRSTVYEGFDKFAKAFTFNNSMINRGIYELANGLGINASGVAGQFFAKYGYVATFKNNLAPGTYDVTVAYVDGQGSSISDTAKLTVRPRMATPMKFTATVDGHHVYINGNFNPSAEGLVLFEVGDRDVYGLVVDGKVAFDDVFKPGKYSVNAIYLGNSRFGENSTTVSFIVKSQTEIMASNVTVVYANSKNIVVTLKDENGNVLAGKKITVTLNGVSYTQTTDEKGEITVAVPNNLKPKTYPVSVTFAGDSYYVKSSGSCKVVVSKASPKITAKAATFKSSLKTKKYTITLKNNKNKVMSGKKVTIKINKKTYTATTNKKGQAIFKITKLTKKGTFKSVVTYNGDSLYKKATKTVNIKIK